MSMQGKLILEKSLSLRNDEGVYFINIDSAAEVKLTAIQKNKPGQLVFLTPTVPGGQYYLEVRTRFREPAELRTGRLDEMLESAGIAGG